MVIGLILLFLIIIVIEAPSLIQKKQWKEMIVFLVLLLLGVVYSIGQIYNWPLPNPNRKMEQVVEPLYKMLENVLS